MIEQAIGRLWVLGPAAVLALFLSSALLVLLRPWLARYAMALREFVAPTYRPERHYMRGPGPACARRRPRPSRMITQ